MRRRGKRAGERDDPETETSERPARTQGPFDDSEVDLDAVLDTAEVLDLGSLLVPSSDDLEVQLQLNEETGDVLAVLIGNEQGAIDVRAFAASKSGGMWEEARREIAADAARRGGTATEQTGPFGTELYCEVPVTTPDGQSGVQPSRVLGHDGPRWFLRATLLGQPAMDASTDGSFIRALRGIVVRRGQEAMPPGEALPITLPPQAQRME